jgi:uncharacterized membrane protein YidH (DUF202 family)
MSVRKILGVVLIAAGVLALVYGGFSYPKESREAKLGPLQIAVQTQGRVNVPVWAGVGAIAVGVVLLLVGGKR